MSFSSEVKEELEKHISNARHCQIAEMAAFVINISNVFSNENTLVFSTENKGIVEKLQIILKKAYNIESEIKTEIKAKEAKISTYHIEIDKQSDIDMILKSIKVNFDKQDCEKANLRKVSDLIIKNTCCKKAYLQDSFMGKGSLTNPEKGYHLEFVSSRLEKLEQIREIIATFDIEMKMTKRKNSHVLYIKEGTSIVDLLNIMGAHVSLMNMENARIIKDMRNNLNRKVNCEAANIIKSINAASKQLEDINYIKDNGGFKSLPEALKQMAVVRLENPDTPLKDLGILLDPPVGKSGVNHRLRRLSEIANEMRDSGK